MQRSLIAKPLLWPALFGVLLNAGWWFGSAALQTGKHLLRVSDRVGQANRYRIAFDMRMRAEYSGPGEPDARTRQLMETLASGMGLQTAVEYELKLMEVAGDGTRTFEVRWYAFEFSGDIGGRPVAPPPGHQESVRDLLSETARVRTTPTGRTLDVAYSHPRIARLAQRLAQMEGVAPTYLPEEPVEIGDRWSSVAQFPVGLGTGGEVRLTLELEHTLVELREGPDGPFAVIELSGSYSRLQGMEDVGLGVPMHLQASLTGFNLFDINQGRFTGGHYEIDMFALHAADGVEIQLTGHADGNLELLNAP